MDVDADAKKIKLLMWKELLASFCQIRVHLESPQLVRLILTDGGTDSPFRSA